MIATAPLVCKPLGTLRLAEVQAFPPAAAHDLEREHEVRTLFDLQPHVEQHGNDVDAVRKAFVVLGVRKEHLDQCTWALLRYLNPSTVPPIANPKPERKPRTKKVIVKAAADMSAKALECGAAEEEIEVPDHGEGEGTNIAAAGATAVARASSESDAPTPSPYKRACQDCLKLAEIGQPIDHLPDCTLQDACPVCKREAGLKCTIRRKLSDKPHKERAALRTTVHHSAPPDDFDENTPPPRTRPKGDRVPWFVRVPAGESIISLFFEWDKEGRIPAGSVLCLAIDSEFGTRPAWMVAATVWPPPLGEPGEELPDAKLERWFVRVSIEQRAKRGEMPAKHVVMSPRE